ncbi:MAG: AAA family ATPase [Gammaproteobacteria bacterium]|nr:AAA family ATPase [Gammaproteobacteria bacterium]
MLKQLFIKNFILIDALELNFDHGVIMITGETGAGKSIILGAIDMALGNQRGGAEKNKNRKNRS